MSYERPNISAMAGYVWGEQPTDTRTIKLNTNENPYPPSPKVDAALGELTGASLRRYPQPTALPLRESLARHHQLTPDHFVVTNGGDEALRLALTTFVEPGAGFGMAEPSYSLYEVLAQIQDARVVHSPLDGQWHLADNFAEQMNDESVQLTCLVNPHAPSGTLATAQQMSDIATALNGVLLIDEAYVDFVDPQIGYSAVPLLAHHDNVLILRTFSKGYGLAGLRLGYLMGSPSLLAPVMWKTRDSYNMDHLSQVVGQAAFEDQAYARETWRRVREERERLRTALSACGLTSPESQSNFLLVDCSEAPITAPALYQALKDNHILVRHFDTDRLRQSLRITIGTPEENDQLLAAIDQALSNAALTR